MSDEFDILPTPDAIAAMLLTGEPKRQSAAVQLWRALPLSDQEVAACLASGCIAAAQAVLIDSTTPAPLKAEVGRRAQRMPAANSPDFRPAGRTMRCCRPCAVHDALLCAQPHAATT
eukprot:PLAT9099.1.p2 GENE.PLAT9099.1~~PLAT9099.1.p2  ORF type:complete len:117 (-),score=2.14 PLAT9099.1:135-485(-)